MILNTVSVINTHLQAQNHALQSPVSIRVATEEVYCYDAIQTVVSQNSCVTKTAIRSELGSLLSVLDHLVGGES